ncbi:hypothetical protein AAG570_013439 [Ranatra chinensis]|uniref:Uncharacterized protein n=1 Tax=Ranatra chinensis TaxID=642074 RepID=A0ABD0YC56_9HEMI
MDWVLFGLDFEEGLNQVQLGLKIRHIKAGIRLVEALANCGDEITQRMIAETDAQNKLIEMYHCDYMALSIKLMILRSLDATLRYKSCVEKFLEKGKKDTLSGYQRLIEMVRGNQLARVKYAITAILQKLNLYEILTKLSATVSNTLGPKLEDPVGLDFLTMTLEELLKMYVEAPFAMSQPKRFMPVSSQFEIPVSSAYSDPYGAIFTYFRSTGILRSCVSLLTHPATSCCPSVVAPIHELIAELLESDGGMKFLATSLETNQLIRILVGNQDEGELGNPGTNPTLGMHLAYRLQALSYIDSLDDIPPGDDDPDKLEVLDALQGLFCLTLSNIGNIGKAAVVHVLSRGDNLSVLLRYFKQKSSLRRRSPARGYIVDLLTITVKHSDYVPFLQKYSQQILELLADSPELGELQKWLKPVDSPAAFSYDNVSPIVEYLKNNIENCTSLPGEMVTAVRVLRHLGIPPHESDLVSGTFLSEYRQLKYKCVVLQLFSLDGLGHLMAILQKLCNYYEQPALHSARLAGRHGLALLAFMLPAVQLVRRMLTYVIGCRNTDFKDLTGIPILLQTYALMSSIPLNAQAHTDAQRVCRDIVETLLAYTQPVSSETCTESEALNKSLWTLMVSEVLKFTTELPANFMAGLSVLSELLPLPLPLQTRSSISDEEASRAVNSRKLWSAHLHSLSPIVAETIAAMSGSTYRPLLDLLRRVCIQLADLAAPTALVVARTLVDSIADTLSPSEGPSSQQHLVRLLNFLACLVTQGSVKSAFLFLVTKNSGMKNNEKYVNAMQSLIALLKASSADSVQSQECFLSIVQSLCDAEVSLVPPPGLAVASNINVTNEMYLANALPAKDLLVTLCAAVVEHVSCSNHGLSTMLPAMRTLLLLTEHDYGFYHLKV